MANKNTSTAKAPVINTDVVIPPLNPEVAHQREVIVINVPATPAHKGGQWSDAASNIAGALAWPLTILLFLWLFRAPITRFIDRLRTFKGAGMEVSAEEMIEEQLPTRQLISETYEVDPLVSPIATIVTSWVNVEKAARDAAMRVLPAVASGTRTMPYSTVLRNVEAIDRAGLLKDPAVRPLISDLAKIRNQAVHRPDEPISRDALSQFVANANWAITSLEQVKTET